jgi:hypothetical protein
MGRLFIRVIVMETGGVGDGYACGRKDFARARVYNRLFVCNRPCIFVYTSVYLDISLYMRLVFTMYCEGQKNSSINRYKHKNNFHCYYSDSSCCDNSNKLMLSAVTFSVVYLVINIVRDNAGTSSH